MKETEMKPRRAFSLIELLVVVSILGILAAVSVPAYTSYKTRSRVVSVYNYAQSIANDIALKYQQTGSWPTSINFGGTTVTANGATAPASCVEDTPISGLPACQMSYSTKTFSANNNVAALIQVILSPSFNFGSTNFLRLAVSIDKSKNQTTFPCGIWNGAANNMPSAYLPSACTCIYMQDYQGSATSATCG